MTAAEALRTGSERLRPASESARADAARLLEAALECDAAWLLAHGSEPLPSAAGERYERALARRAAGEPVAYIVGYAGFYGRRFAVSPDVLVPRPETEHLVELVLAGLRGVARPAICDVGTGSGILAITLACERPDARVVAVDASRAALALARDNALAHGVVERVAFREGDLLAPAAAAGPFDAIVANLPYVPSGELAARPDPTSFEPRDALDGGPDGLALYRRLLADAPALVQPGGTAVFEAAPGNAAELAVLTARAFGPSARVAVHRDYAGRERAVLAETSP